MDVLLNDEQIVATETDIYPGPRVQLICDAHALPFRNGTFDGVVIQAVLEHVFDPPAVVAEIHRVLRDDGVVYSEIPFMQQVHEGPYDFTRYTELGHRRLFRYFAEIERGAVAGPFTTLAWSLRYLGRAVAPDHPVAQAAYAWFATLCTSWLKHLDRVVATRPAAGDGASGTYFLGARQSEPVPDEQIVRSYRGSIGAPDR